MNQILRMLLPKCATSSRLALSSAGTSGLLHVLAVAALASWFGSIAPNLFPPRQGFNSIQLTASQEIRIESVNVEVSESEAVKLEFVEPSHRESRINPSIHREAIQGAELDHESIIGEEHRIATARLPSTMLRRSQLDHPPSTTLDPAVIPRREVTEQAPPTQTSVASIASREDAGQLDAIPTQIYSPQPLYPPEALQRQVEGRVVLRVEIAADGSVASASVLQSSGHAMLDSAAKQAVLRWRFDPPQRLGVAVRTTIAVPIRFQIEHN